MKNELFSTRSVQNVYAQLLARFPDYKLNPRNIVKILRSKTYTGGKFKGVFYKNKFPVLITEDEHEKIIKILDNLSRERKYFYLFKDLLFCSECNHKLTCIPGKSATGRIYYIL